MDEETTEETATETVVETETTTVSPDAAKALAKEIGDSVMPGLEAQLKGMFESIKPAETAVSKNLNAGQTDEDPEAARGGAPTMLKHTDYEKLSSPMVFAKQVKAQINGDYQELKSLNEFAIDMRQKAGYNNTGVSAEGGLIVHLPDFDATIERLLPKYGGLVNEVPYVDVTGNTAITTKGTNNFGFQKVLEGAAKPAFKPGYSQQTITLYKQAGIIAVSQELLEDQAVDFWDDATRQISYAYNKRIDEMLLTDNGTTSAEKGILHTSGVQYEPVTGPTGATWDDLLNMKYKVPTEAAPGGVYVMHRSTLNLLRQLKATDNQYLGMTAPFFTENGLVTPWGDRIILTDAMPDTGQANWNGTTNGGGVVYGDFSRYAKIYRKSGGLTTKVSDQATIVDAAGATQNMWQNNLVAMLAEFRASAFFKFPEAFAVAAQTNVS